MRVLWSLVLSSVSLLAYAFPESPQDHRLFSQHSISSDGKPKASPLLLPECLPLLAAMSSPAPGSVLPGSTLTFTWTSASYCATAYWLDVGTIQGQGNLFASGNLATSVTSQTVNGIPTTGSVIYVRLWTQNNGSNWQYNDYTYMAYNGGCALTV